MELNRFNPVSDNPTVWIENFEVEVHRVYNKITENGLFRILPDWLEPDEEVWFYRSRRDHPVTWETFKVLFGDFFMHKYVQTVRDIIQRKYDGTEPLVNFFRKKVDLISTYFPGIPTRNTMLLCLALTEEQTFIRMAPNLVDNLDRFFLLAEAYGTPAVTEDNREQLGKENSPPDEQEASTSEIIMDNMDEPEG